MSRYELSLHPDYVPDWTLVDGVREFLQNALDQQIVNPRNKMTVNYDEETQRLRIGSKSSSLDKASLLLGCSSKGNDADLVGQFGEGYKLGLLVLTRAGKKVVIENYIKRELWTAKIINSRRYDSQLLCVDVEKYTFTTPPTSDLTFDIHPISKEEWESIVKSNINLREYPECLETSAGKILLSANEAGKAYVNGLFICATESKYGYDFSPKAIKLDRDRKFIRDFELNWATSKMWLRFPKDPRFLELVKAEAPDTEHASNNVWGDHMAVAIAYAAFIEEHGIDAYPVSSEQEIADIKKFFPKAKVIIVGSGHAALIRKHPSFDERKNRLSDAPPPEAPEKLLRKHLLKYKKKMGTAELISFERLVSSSIFWKDSRS